MNGPFDFSPEALAREAMQMQAKLGAGLGTLREVDDVTYGATEREEVWRDGKVVLYRFRGETEPTAEVPLLISYALVNRPYMPPIELPITQASRSMPSAWTSDIAASPTSSSESSGKSRR